MSKQHPDAPGVWLLTVTPKEGRGRSSCGELCGRDGRELGLPRAAVPVPALPSLPGASGGCECRANTRNRQRELSEELKGMGMCFSIKMFLGGTAGK